MMYMVIVIRNGKTSFETFQTLTAAKASYKLLVQPKNPHSLNHWVFLSRVMESYRHMVG
jgi:hypothetical protein